MNPYYMSNNYMQNMQSLQNMKEQIERQMSNMQYQPQTQIPTNLTQNFQLAPQTQSELDGKYASNINEVKETLTLKSTLFIDKEFKNLWIKSADGIIKTFILNEVVELDEKDKTILELKNEIERLKEANNVQSDVTSNDENITTKKSSTSKSTKSSDE